MPVLAFMSYGGAFLAMMALVAGLFAYAMLAMAWWDSRADWVAVVLIAVPFLLAFWIWWDLRQAKRGVSIDIVCKDPETGDHFFILVHSAPWTEDESEWPALQSRLNDYVGAAVRGRRDRTLPFHESRPTRVLIISPEKPGDAIVDAVRKADELVRVHGVSISWTTKDDYGRYLDDLRARMPKG